MTLLFSKHKFCTLNGEVSFIFYSMKDVKIVTLELFKQIKLIYHKGFWFVAVQFVYFFLSQFFLVPLHITTKLYFNFGLTQDIKMPVLASKVRLNDFPPFITIFKEI